MSDSMRQELERVILDVVSAQGSMHPSELVNQLLAEGYDAETVLLLLWDMTERDLIELTGQFDVVVGKGAQEFAAA